MDNYDMLTPKARREWLLTMALQQAPLFEALKLAQAAENFVTGGSKDIDPVPKLELAKPFHTVLQRPYDTASLPPIDAVMLKQGEADGDLPVENLDFLLSLVSIEDVIRYLNEHDEIVVSQPDGNFLINGGSRADLDGLLERANQMRTKQGLPHFSIQPVSTANP